LAARFLIDPRCQVARRSCAVSAPSSGRPSPDSIPASTTYVCQRSFDYACIVIEVPKSHVALHAQYATRTFAASRSALAACVIVVDMDCFPFFCIKWAKAYCTLVGL